MIDQLLIAILAALISPIIIAVFASLVREGLIVKLLGGISKKEIENLPQITQMKVESGTVRFERIKGPECFFKDHKAEQAKVIDWDKPDVSNPIRLREIRLREIKEIKSISLSFTRLDVVHSHGTNLRIHTWAEILNDQDEFQIMFVTWDDSYVVEAQVSWTVIGH